MRLYELHARPSMSDIDLVRRGVAELKSVTASFDVDNGTATIRFYLDGNEGWLKVKAKPQSLKSSAEAMASRVRACATSQSRGKRPLSIADALRALRGHLGPNCIKMLVQSPDLDLIAMKWDTVEFG